MANDRDVRHRTVVLTKEMDEAIYRMRQDERYSRKSISELIRILIQSGLESIKTDSRPA